MFPRFSVLDRTMTPINCQEYESCCRPKTWCRHHRSKIVGGLQLRHQSTTYLIWITERALMESKSVNHCLGWSFHEEQSICSWQVQCDPTNRSVRTCFGDDTRIYLSCYDPNFRHFHCFDRWSHVLGSNIPTQNTWIGAYSRWISMVKISDFNLGLSRSGL